MGIRNIATISLRSISQLVFSEDARAGLLLLIGLSIITPFLGIKVILATLIATLCSYFYFVNAIEYWRRGGFGYNAVFVAIVLSSNHPYYKSYIWWLFFVCTIIFVILIDKPLRSLCIYLKLPALTIAAHIVLWLSIPFFYFVQAHLWLPTLSIAFWVGIAVVIAAMIWVQPFAFLYSSLIAGAILVALLVFPIVISPYLFAITINAFFGCYIISVLLSYANKSRYFISPLVAILSCTITFIWLLFFSEQLLPPLLAPSILGSWISIKVLKLQ